MKTIRTTAAFLGPFPSDAHMVWEGVPDDVAADIVNQGNAVYIDKAGDVVTVEDPLAKLTQEYAPVITAGPDPLVGGEDWEYKPVAEAADEPKELKELKRPYGNASKAAWVEWALHADPGLTEEAAKGMSKNQLMTAYGERL